MKAKLLLSVAAIGFAAISPASAETVIIPVVPGSLDGANSTTGDGGPGGPASAIANSPSNSTNSAFATGGAGGSGGNNGGAGGAASASATTTTTDASGNASSLIERDGRRRGFWQPVYRHRRRRQWRRGDRLRRHDCARRFGDRLRHLDGHRRRRRGCTLQRS